jgi:uncharacterized protein
MRIPFAAIAKTGSTYSITDAAWLTEAGLRSTKPVCASLTLHRTGDHRVEVEGSVGTGIQLTCDRCLNDCNFLVDVRFHVVLLHSSEHDWSGKEVECRTAYLDVIEVDEPVADVEDILRQQVLLSLPTKQLCSLDCQGLCSRCGGDLNREHCPCSAGAAASPFAVLNNVTPR